MECNNCYKVWMLGFDMENDYYDRHEPLKTRTSFLEHIRYAAEKAKELPDYMEGCVPAWNSSDEVRD